jgi:hypothetical protein
LRKYLRARLANVGSIRWSADRRRLYDALAESIINMFKTELTSGPADLAVECSQVGHS